jgi:hypothetical protein
METHLKIIGLLLICLALVHIIFPKYFNWKEEFSGVDLLNRQMMYVHTFFIALIVLLMGLLCFFSAQQIINTPLGKTISLGLFIFWFFRLLIQFFGYSSRLWRGKTFETTIHILFSITWIYFSLIFFLIYIN